MLNNLMLVPRMVKGFQKRESPSQACNAAAVTTETPCKFWNTQEGCRKADKCKFTHTLLDPKENRCFTCSGLGHSKRECPHVGGNKSTKKVAKATPEKEKGENSNKGDTGKGKGSKEVATTATSQTPKPASSGETGSVKSEPAAPAIKKGSAASEPTADATGSEGIGSLLHEASLLMKSLRPSLKMVSLKKATADEIRTGLLDGGATNALRQGTPQELAKASPVTVELAAGSIELFQDVETGTLLSSAPVEPIVPLRGLVSLGYRIKWDSKGCLIHHEVLGPLKCWLRNGCPVVHEDHALVLIQELETLERKRRLGPKLAGESVSQGVVDWWNEMFPSVPPQVLQHMVGQDHVPKGEDLPWNRRARKRFRKAKGLIIHLFSGNKESSRQWKQGWPKGVEVLCLDIKDDPRMDLNDPKVWGYVCHLVRTKPIIALIGGPPCRSISRLRNIRPGPPPLRGRTEDRWGLPDLSLADQAKTDSDSALVLKQVALFRLAEWHRGSSDPPTGFLMESPEDPAGYAKELHAPTYWTWPEVTQLLTDSSMQFVHFDQGCFGHTQVKPTTCLTNLPLMSQLHESRCAPNHGAPLRPDLASRLQQTASWADWSVGLKRAIRASLGVLVQAWNLEHTKVKKTLSQEQWEQHIRQGHRPFRRDCKACVLDMGADKPHRRRLGAGSSAWSMGVDIVPLIPTLDETTNTRVKYVMVSTVLVPVLGQTDHKPPKNPDDENVGWGEGFDHDDGVPVFLEDSSPSVGALPMEPPPTVGAHEGNFVEGEHPPSVGAHEGKSSAEVDHPPSVGARDGNPSVEVEHPPCVGVHEGNPSGENPLVVDVEPPSAGARGLSDVCRQCQEPLSVKHVTLSFPMASRKAPEVIHALNTLLTKYQHMGIHVDRLHSDKARELVESKQVQRWCAARSILHTTTGGDNPASNGHTESEVHQPKRRTRFYLRQACLDPGRWPLALRYATEERLRQHHRSQTLFPFWRIWALGR